MTDIESVINARKALESKMEILDVFINNAGINGALPKAALKAPANAFKKVMVSFEKLSSK
nr:MULTISPECIES: hypothetical protein [unclassified Sphingobacterium]